LGSALLSCGLHAVNTYSRQYKCLLSECIQFGLALVVARLMHRDLRATYFSRVFRIKGETSCLSLLIYMMCSFTSSQEGKTKKFMLNMQEGQIGVVCSGSVFLFDCLSAV